MSYNVLDPRSSHPVSIESTYGGGDQPHANQGSVNLSAQTNPALDALLQRSNRYMDTLESNTGGAMTKAAQLVRDAREGGKRTLQQNEAMRGVGSSNAQSNYEAGTTGLETKALSDVAAAREATLGGAIQGALGIARAPAEMSLQERHLGLSAAQLQQQAAQANMDRWLALLNATRNSPVNQHVYTGAGGGGIPSV
jgi:hypothetical protein